MLAMAGTGAAIAAFISERGTAVVGLFTCYLVASSWLTARRRDGEAGGFERAGLAVALACAAAMLSFGLIAANSPTGKFDSLPAAAHFPFAFLAALAAGLDLNFILRGRLERRQRIARHLWRMCAALAIAAFSFFLGQQDEFPAAWQGLAIWFVPPVAVLAAMAFWLVRVRFSAAFGHPVRERRSAYQS
jgi:peptidoglycan/LPS O-acetylase OafA/YrhL